MGETRFFDVTGFWSFIVIVISLFIDKLLYIFRMFLAKVLVVFLIWSNALIKPQRWLKKRLNALNIKFDHHDTKTDRIDENVKIIKGELGK